MSRNQSTNTWESDINEIAIMFLYRSLHHTVNNLSVEALEGSQSRTQHCFLGFKLTTYRLLILNLYSYHYQLRFIEESL